MGKDMKFEKLEILILKKQMNMMDLIKTNLLHNLPLIAQMQIKAGKTKYSLFSLFCGLSVHCLHHQLSFILSSYCPNDN